MKSCLFRADGSVGHQSDEVIRGDWIWDIERKKEELGKKGKSLVTFLLQGFVSAEEVGVEPTIV